VDLRVTVDPDLPELLNEPVVAFGRFRGFHAGLTIYGPDGIGSALSRLYIDLICGRPLPLTLFTRSVQSLEAVVAASLFLDRELLLHPKAAELVTAVELVTQLREGGLAHVDRDLARLLLLVDGYLAPPSTKAEQGRRLGQVVEWLRGYALDGGLPALSREPEPPTILDRGTNGFVLATSAGHLAEAVVELYRQGHLRGVVFHPLEDGRERVLAFRKSPHVRFDLKAAAAHLNAVETALQRQSGRWADERFLLTGPREGTTIPRHDLIETFLRV
jgi:hypothetical protein